MEIKKVVHTIWTRALQPKILLILGFAAVGLIILIGFKTALQIINGSSLEFVAGVWSTLASDLKEGIFYRPVFSEIGIGGTRYMPLYFCLQSVLLNLPVTPLVAGHIANGISGILLLFAIYLTIGREKLPFAIIISFVAVYLSLGTVQNGFTNVGGDMLPLAFTIFGIASVLKKETKNQLLIASLFFMLAFAAKITAIQGFSAVLLWFLVRGKNKQALHLGLFTVSGYALVIGIITIVSRGRFIEIMTSCASSGTTLNMLVKSPLFFISTMFYKDALCLVLVFWAFTSISTNLKTCLSGLPFVLWVMTILQSTAIFASPGTNYNHLVDIGAASLILIAWSLKTNYKAGLPLFSLSITAFLFISFCINYKGMAKEFHSLGVQRVPDELVSYIKNHPGVLSEDPLPVLHANQTPFMLDPFMACQILKSNDNIRTKCIAKIEQNEFSAVIFAYDPQTDPDWYNGVNFGGDLTKAILTHYTEKTKFGDYRIYEPLKGN